MTFEEMLEYKLQEEMRTESGQGHNGTFLSNYQSYNTQKKDFLRKSSINRNQQSIERKVNKSYKYYTDNF
jgi:hypothetical protein